MDGTVLIADDDRTIRTVLTQALTRAGCRVHATGSLAQLSKWVEEGRGDLVITDVMMPDGNGIDRIPAIRDARPDLPVIVISAQNTIVTAISDKVGPSLWAIIVDTGMLLNSEVPKSSCTTAHSHFRNCTMKG